MFAHLLAAALSLSIQDVAPVARLCPTGATPAWQNVADAEQAYGLHSIAIVNAALAGDERALAGLVAHHAGFGAAVADSGFGPGIAGPAAAIEFFRGLAPSDYMILAPYAAMVSLQPCAGITTELLLSGPDRSAVLRFRYEQGMLVEVSGRLIKVTQGQLGRRSVD